jgi:hypothetical protein
MNWLMGTNPKSGGYRIWEELGARWAGRSTTTSSLPSSKTGRAGIYRTAMPTASRNTYSWLGGCCGHPGSPDDSPTDLDSARKIRELQTILASW